MHVVVAFPWRPTPDREQAFRYVWEWYSGGPELVAVDSDPTKPFNRAAARNACVRVAEQHGADVVVINDADTVANMDAFTSAIRDAFQLGGVHFGLDRMHYLTAEETEALYRGIRPASEGLPHDSSVIAVRPGDWWAIGGQDERFDGWGGEDNSFTLAAGTLLGTTWHQGTAWSLHHDGSCRDIGSARWQPNSDLLQRYVRANGDPTAMRALIVERAR